MSHDNDWREAKKEADRVVWFGISRSIVIGVSIVIVTVLVGALLWAGGVFTSGIKGQGDAQSQKNSAPNWTQAQADFHKYYEGIVADDRKINDTAEELKSDPDNSVLKTNLNGLKNHCVDLVATYNTKAESYLSKDFRDANLPPRIDNNDPSTDCKENQK